MSSTMTSANMTTFSLGSWTASQLKAAANITHYAPSVKDLLLAGPRIGMKLGSLFFVIPETIDDALGGRIGQRIIPEATNIGGIEAIVTAGADAVNGAARAGADIIIPNDNPVTGGLSSLSIEGTRSFGNIVAFTTSKWALGCIVMAIILNRTHIYASPRRALTLGWKLRFTLRIIPIILFSLKAISLLQSIQCQTSPDFGMLRWGNASMSSDLMFTQNGGLLHTISSSLLLGASDEESCFAVKMIPPEFSEDSPDTIPDLSGSLSQLWPLFETLCFSQFVETLSCAVQGRQVAAETGLTLFEHSLAFAEAEAAVSSTLGWGPFGEKRSGGATTLADDRLAEYAIKRSMIMSRVNTPPEVLLVGLLSSLNHITSHMLGIFQLQGRFRLLNTAFWGLCFMSVITWSILNFSVDDVALQALLRFPTVCIIGFIPHVLVLAGIILCSVIYSMALLLNALAHPSGTSRDGTFMQKLRSAHDNMQANVSLSSIRISMHMDFYQALLKTGYNVLTMASEAVYLNESSEVVVKPRTWLEEDRLKEIESVRMSWLLPSSRDHQNGGDGMADDVGLITTEVDSAGHRLTNGYARERVAPKGGKSKVPDRTVRDGIGATERSGRWIMAFEFFIGIFRLVASWTATITLKLMSQSGIQRRPRLLTWMVNRPKSVGKEARKLAKNRSDTLDFWMLDVNGDLVLPNDDHVDVEAEMRRRLKGDKHRLDHNDEQVLESNLYGWWLSGGWWGGDDNSGQFIPAENEDEDTTSMISMSSAASEQDWESDGDDDDGRRTPTQYSPQLSRESTPMLDTPMSAGDLAQLLHPRTPDQRAEAQALAAHLASDRIMTRSRYEAHHLRERTKVLTSTRERPADFQMSAMSTKLTPEEETELLEYLITSRRANHDAAMSSTDEPSSWAQGAAGMGEGGPQCVVCQSAPRSIIVWPCRCLSLCDDCRVTLAMNNFDKCVCCRRDVGSFSRIFVP